MSGAHNIKKLSFDIDEKLKQDPDYKDTWSLGNSMFDSLYKKLKLYLKVSESIINLEFHDIEIDGVVKTQKEWILEMISLYEKYIEIDENSLEYEEFDLDKYKDEENQKHIVKKQFWNIWMHINEYMWW